MTISRPFPTRALLLALLASLATAFAAGAAPARAASGAWWLVKSTPDFRHLKPGTRAIIYSMATDIGYEGVTGTSTNKVTISDTVPAGLKVINVDAEAGVAQDHGKFETLYPKCRPPVGQTYTCELEGSIRPAEDIRVQIEVEVEAGDELGSTLTNAFEVKGGETPKGETPGEKTIETKMLVSDEPVKFEAERFEIRPETDEGKIDTQAGSHPFQLTSVFDLAKIAKYGITFGLNNLLPFLPALPRDLHFTLPPGMVGAVAHMPKCDGTNFTAVVKGENNGCEPDTAIGFANTTLDEPLTLGPFTLGVPIFNLTPDAGEPARFGFIADTVPVVLTTHVVPGSYAVEVTVHYLPESIEILSTEATFWGVPGDSRHNMSRSWECLGGGYDEAGERECNLNYKVEHPQALLTLPTSCENENGEPIQPVANVHALAWTGQEFNNEFNFKAFEGCASLPFSPTIEVQPEEHSAATPTGLNVTVKLPQETTLSGEAPVSESAVKATTLELPVGIQPSAGAADGLATCTSNEFGFLGVEEPPVAELSENDRFNQEPVTCPEAAKIGTVDIKTPLIEEDLTGSVYLAKENTNPFTGELVLYIFAESKLSKVQVKLAGPVKVNPKTGQLVSRFKNTPPVAFSELKLHLFNGPRASQSTPEACGTYGAHASFTAWSKPKAEEAVGVDSPSFEINSGPNGTPCPAPGTQPFSPTFQGGTQNLKAGAFSPLEFNIYRPDGNQQLKSLTIHLPEGSAALLASLTPCPIAIATEAEPNCPESSLMGESIAYAGLGKDHVEIPGKVYLTGPYKNAPFGVLDVSDARKIGSAPLNLGEIPVMSTITVNETTAAATITSDPLPERVKGVAAQISALHITTANRAHPNLAFNPTNCSKALSFTGAMTGYGPGGADGTTPISYPFQPEDCAGLPFKPTIGVSIESNVSRSEGTGLVITVKSSAGQSNIGKTKLEFPSIIPSRLPTLQKSCPDSTFNVNPASCSKESIVGTAVAHTPVLKEPLSGPVYLVSHGGRELPDAEIVLQGENGIKLVLDGTTDIEKANGKSVTISSFEAVPDAPVETFEVQLPRSTKSAFSGYGDLCTEKPVIESKFTGQNGAYLQEETAVTVTGCAGVESFKKHSPETELQKNLKKCAKLSAKSKRAKCVASAHKRASALAACKKDSKKSKRAACEVKARKKNALKL